VPVVSGAVEPAVGVVIPAFRRPDLLAQAVASVAAQTTAPVDVVVVHDEPEVPVAAASIPGVRHRCTGGGVGASASRNLGAAVVEGTHIAFLDDDDTWKPTYLQEASAALAASSASMCLTRIEVVVGDRRRPGPILPDHLGVDVALNRVVGITGSSIVVARAAFDAVGGFDPALRGANDLDFLVRLLDAGTTHVLVPEPLVEHRHHPGKRLTTSPTRAADLEAFRLKWWDHLDRRGRRRLEADVVASRRRNSRGALERVWLTLHEVRLIGPRAALGRLHLPHGPARSGHGADRPMG
jgi:GT2 family glycosyltransferase